VDTASVKINVRNAVFLPSAFTPNADGHNDEFKVYGAGIEQLSLNVYDQKGEIVFQSNDWQQIQEKGWDGKKRGQVLESDVYLWVINGNYYNGEEVRFQGEVKGFVKLLR
jgi:gliding motility-associated-like protein